MENVPALDSDACLITELAREANPAEFALTSVDKATREDGFALPLVLGPLQHHLLVLLLAVAIEARKAVRLPSDTLAQVVAFKCPVAERVIRS